MTAKDKRDRVRISILKRKPFGRVRSFNLEALQLTLGLYIKNKLDEWA